MYLAVALGGALGSAGRYFIAGQAVRLMGVNFPWGTLTVNIVGSVLMGILIETLALRLSVTPEMRAFLVVGFLGGFTTFSAFSLDVSVLVERNQLGAAALYAVGSVILSVGGLFAGLALMRRALT